MPYGTVNADLMTTSDGVSSAGLYGFKNRIINGAMVIDQRNAGASVTPAATSSFVYTLDRWSYYATQASKFSIQRNAASVTPPTGYTNYIGLTSASAYSSTSTDQFFLSQQIEGYNIADLAWGTASAATVTLSFWVRSSLTGQFSATIENLAGTRSYVSTYTINSANTWEQKTLTIPGSTGGVWASDNTVGMYVIFNLGVGANFLTTAGTWYSGGANGATGDVKVVGTSGATFYVTGVQLEKGSTATSFDYLDYGRSLAQCQRYYVQFSYVSGSNIIPSACFNNATTNGLATIMLPVTMRTAPTGIVISSASHFTYSTGTSNLTPSAVTFTAAGPSNVSVNCTVTGATVGSGGLFYFTSTSGAYIGVSGTEL